MTTVRVVYVVASVLLSGVAMVAAGAEFSVFAAGSLRAPLADLAQAYERDSDNKARLTFGASGLLRDRISGGERADVFASAHMERNRSRRPAGRRMSNGSRGTAYACSWARAAMQRQRRHSTR